MSDWSSHAARSIQQQKNNEQLKAAKAQYDQETLNLSGPGLWQNLRQLLTRMCTELNSESGMRDTLAYDESNPAQLRIEHTARKSNLVFSFDGQRHHVGITGAVSKVYGIQIIEGTRETCFMDGNMSIQAHEIARKALDNLLGI